jgi:aconitase A
MKLENLISHFITNIVQINAQMILFSVMSNGLKHATWAWTVDENYGEGSGREHAELQLRFYSGIFH